MGRKRSKDVTSLTRTRTQKAALTPRHIGWARRKGRASKTNAITRIDSVMMLNNHPDELTCSEHVDLLFQGRVPMSSLSTLVLDEQQFLTKEELREKVEEGLTELNPRELKFAHGILAGKKSAEAYIDAGYETGLADGLSHKDRVLRARKESARARKRDSIATYISAVLRLNHLEALEAVGYTHIQWLEAQRSVLEMALGQRPIRKVFIKEGTPEEHDVKDVCLGVANKSLETLAKHYGWLNEKLHVEGVGLGPTVLLRDFTGAKPENAEDGEQGEENADEWDS